MRRRLFLAATLTTACSRKREPLQVFNTIPEFTLTDQNGDDFTYAAKLKGHVWVADFIFTTCTGPCPRLTTQMSRVQEELGGAPNIKLVSFTVDPVNDTPSALTEYGKRYKADFKRWSFLTGATETLHKLNREAFMLGNVDGRNTSHSTRFVLIDQQGRVRKYYDTTEADVIGQVVADARELAGAAS
ncbi:MAG: SCO family protein [Bryobacterales bacterium]|nr:SCO family protein [Bryobacterales bacterium]